MLQIFGIFNSTYIWSTVVQPYIRSSSPLLQEAVQHKIWSSAAQDLEQCSTRSGAVQHKIWSSAAQDLEQCSTRSGAVLHYFYIGTGTGTVQHHKGAAQQKI
jgi:hypothetical protein